MRIDTQRIPTSLKALAAVAALLAVAAAVLLPLYWAQLQGSTPPDDEDAAIVLVDPSPSLPEAPDPQPEPTGLNVGYRVGDLAPSFSLKSLAGDTVSLESHRGRVVILDFWASWCSPCRASMPHIEAIAERFAADGVVLLGISLDRTLRAAETYLAQLNSPQMLALWGSYTQAVSVARSYGVLGIPHTFLIDRQGIVRFTGHPTRLRDANVAEWL